MRQTGDKEKYAKLLKNARLRRAVDYMKVQEQLEIWVEKGWHIWQKEGLIIQFFLKLDEKYAILNYVAECPDVFGSLTGIEMVKEVERYVSQA